MQLIPRKRLWQAGGLLAADGLLYGLTDTSKVPSFTLIIGFLLATATLYMAAYALISFLRLYGLPIRRKRRVAMAVTILGGSLLALQSSGQLNSYDVIVLLALAAIGYFYSFYGRASQKSSET